MNMFSPAEIAQSYCAAGKTKAERTLGKMFVLAVLAGFIIAIGAVFSNTAAHSIGSVGPARLISGLLFAFGLPLVMLTGAELFTGNTLICITVADKKTTLLKMLRNWLVVYLGNFVASLLVAAGCAFFGQLNYSSGGLAVYTIKVAAAKCALPFGNALVLGIFCNVLVCMGVLASLSAKDTTGKVIGAFMPVAIFVTAGFEHSVANMYYIPAGIFANMVPEYAQLAAAAGINTAGLTWGNMLAVNLLPVTLGNIIGGVALGLVMWGCFLRQSPQKS